MRDCTSRYESVKIAHGDLDSRRRGSMPGGRWDSQTRIAVVVVGMLVVTIGVLSTLQWRSGIGAAALVIGGLLVSLAGVAGGTIFGPREAREIHVIAQPQPIEAGPIGERDVLIDARRSTAEVERDAEVLTLEAPLIDTTGPAGATPMPDRPN